MPVARSAATQGDQEQLRRSKAALRPASARGKGRPAAHPLLALQRQIGNRATVSHLSGPVVQRDDDLEEGVDKTAETFGFLGGQVGNWADMGSITGGEYIQGNAPTGSTAVGMGGLIPEMLGGGVSMGLNIKQATEHGSTLSTEQEAGRGSEATARGAKRGLKSTVTNAVQSGGELVAGGFTGASQISQVMANAGSTTAFAGANNLLGGIGGVIALPFATLSTLRTGRKAAKQYKRFRNLRKDVEDPKTSSSKAIKAFEKQQQAVTALEETRQAAQDELADARRKLISANRSKTKKNAGKYQQLVTARERLVQDLDTKIAEARQELLTAEVAKTQAERAMTEYQDRASRGEESPADIKAYAMRKNQTGFWKKIAGTVGGVLGIGGGIAGTIAAFAGAAATVAVGVTTLATPIGWALCGAAAVIGLGMAGYAFWKWASKRYDRLVKQGGAEKGFKTWIRAMNPFSKNIPSSRREHMADRLYDLAARTPADQEARDARGVIEDLGLSWDRLRMGDAHHRDAAVKLIYEKMAS